MQKLFHGLGLLLFRIQAFENAGNGVARVLGQLLQCFKYTIPSAASCFQLIIPEDEPVSSFDVKPIYVRIFCGSSKLDKIRMIENLFKEHIQRILNPEIQGKPNCSLCRILRWNDNNLLSVILLPALRQNDVWIIGQNVDFVAVNMLTHRVFVPLKVHGLTTHYTKPTFMERNSSAHLGEGATATTAKGFSSTWNLPSTWAAILSIFTCMSSPNLPISCKTKKGSLV